MVAIGHVESVKFFQGRGVFHHPLDIWKGGEGGLKNQTMILMIFHKYLWLVWYEGMIVETNGDHIPGAIQSLMEEYIILLSLRPLFSKIAFLSTPLP